MELAEPNDKVGETSKVLGSAVNCIEDGDEVCVASVELAIDESKLFDVTGVVAAALVSLHRANAMLRVSSTSSSQGS